MIVVHLQNSKSISIQFPKIGLAYQLRIRNLSVQSAAETGKCFPKAGVYHELPSTTTGGTKPHLITNYVGHWTFAPMPTESEQQGLQPWQGFYAISTTFALFIEIEEDHPQAMHQMDCKCEVSQVHRGHSIIMWTRAGWGGGLENQFSLGFVKKGQL